MQRLSAVSVVLFILVVVVNDVLSFTAVSSRRSLPLSIQRTTPRWASISNKDEDVPIDEGLSTTTPSQGDDDKVEQLLIKAGFLAVGAFAAYNIVAFTLGAVADLATSTLHSAGDALSDELMREVGNFVSFLGFLAGAIFEVLKVVVPFVGKGVVAVGKAAAPVVQEAAQQVTEAATPIVQDVAKTVAESASPIVKDAAEVASPYVDVVDSTIRSATDSVTNAVDATIVAPIKGATDSVVNAVDSTIQDATESVTTTIQTMPRIF